MLPAKDEDSRSPRRGTEGGLSGVFAAVLTPFDAGLDPDIDTFVNHCRWLLRGGCTGLVVGGTTGEANSMTVDERVRMIEALSAAGITGGQMIAGTGCCAIADTVRLTRAAIAAGAGAVLMLPPFYYKAVTDEGLCAAFAETIDRVGDSRLRILLYHFPQMSGVPIPIAVVDRLRARFGAVIAGVKDSSGDLANMEALLAAIPELAVFTGSDELLLPLLRGGGAGAITGLSNIAAPLAAEVMAAFRAGDGPRAVAAQARLSNLRQAFLGHPLIAALKAVLAEHTGHPAWRRLRPPLLPLDSASERALASALAGIEFALSR